LAVEERWATDGYFAIVLGASIFFSLDAIGMELFGLMFLVVALILIGVGIVLGLVGCVIAAVLFGIGVISSSVVIGVLTRRPSTGIRAFLLQCALISGVPSGILCAWLAHWLLSAAGPGWLISFYGALGGAVAGVVIALLLDFVFRRLHRWASAKLGKDTRHDIVTPAV
jgi:hypothetical protein